MTKEEKKEAELKAKVEAVQAKLTEMGVEFEADADLIALTALLKEAKKGSKGAKSDGVIVWVKTRAYINDNDRVEAGVYLLDEVPARFAKQKEAITVFEGTVPSRELAKIARWAGVNPDGMDDEELMAKLITPEMTTF